MSNDQLLRDNGWEIVRRRDGEPVLWRNKKDRKTIVTESEAVKRLTRKKHETPR
jgi:hypothetical protein